MDFFLLIQRHMRTAAVAALVTTAAAAMVPDTARAAEDDTIVVGLVAEPVTFDPTQIGDLNTSRVVRRIYEGLTGFVYGTYEIKPQLAQSWDISADGLQYTFKLRPGVVFHDGTPFNAEAVKYSYQRQTDPAHPAHGTLTYRYANNYLGNVAAIDVIDDLTVRFTLKEPQAPFLQYLTNLTLAIISPTALATHVDDVAQNPAGTGPYKLTEWEPGVKAVLSANADYYDGTPQIETLIYVPVIEAQARLSAISTGEIDLTYDIPVESLASLRENPDVAVKTGLSAHVWYVVLNTRLSEPPFDNKLVRQAMNHAIDKEAIVTEILQGTGEVSHSPLSPIYGAYHNPDVRQYPYDPDRARALLAEAGHPDGFSNCEFLVPESGSGMQSPVEMGTFIQAYLMQVGINCTIKTMEWGAYLTEYRNSPQMAQMSWNSTMGDPDYVMYLLFHSSAHPPAWNAGWYANDRVDELLSQARIETDEEIRRQLYIEAQALVVEDAPWIFVDHGQQIVAHRSDLVGFELSPNFDFALEKARIE